MPKMTVNICEVHTVPVTVEVGNALDFAEIRNKAEEAYLNMTVEGSEINLEYSHTLPKEQWHIVGVSGGSEKNSVDQAPLWEPTEARPWC